MQRSCCFSGSCNLKVIGRALAVNWLSRRDVQGFFRFLDEMAARPCLLCVLALAVAVTCVPLHRGAWSENEATSMLSVKATPETGAMTQEALQAMTSRILLRANIMRRRLNTLGITDSMSDADIDKTFSSQLGESKQTNHEKDRLEGLRPAVQYCC